MPLPSTMTPIATQTLASAAATVTFSSIPATYTDLVLVINSGTTAYTDNYLRFNSDTGSNYSYTRIYGTASAGSDRGTSQTTGYIGSADTTLVGNHIINVMNYANTTTNKTFLSRNNYNGSTAAGTHAIVGLWRSTSAINSITLSLSSSTWLANSSFTLYGVKAAS